MCQEWDDYYHDPPTVNDKEYDEYKKQKHILLEYNIPNT